MPWRVYILRCKDNKLYTGITSDLRRRVKEHKKGRGCRFTRCRIPVKLVYSEKSSSRKEALKREAQVKDFTRRKKLQLIRSTWRHKKP